MSADLPPKITFGDFLISFDLLNEEQQKPVLKLKQELTTGSIETLDAAWAIGYESGKYISYEFDGRIPFLINNEEVLWHREISTGLFKKKITAFEVITNFRVFLGSLTTYQGDYWPFILGDDVVVNNQKRISSSERNSTFTGLGRRGTFIGSSGGSSTSESETIGDVNIMAEGKIDYTIVSVEDPNGLAKLIKNLIKNQKELAEEYGKQQRLENLSKDTETKNCVKCGVSNSPDSKFCKKCGTKLKSTCPKCGKNNADDASFCNSCGFALQ